MKSTVSVRSFSRGEDEAAWVEILNAEYKEYESWWRGTTVDGMLELEKHPSFDLEGRFIAEFNGRPVGVVHAHVEKSDKEKNGFIKDFCVLTVFRDTRQSLLNNSVLKQQEFFFAALDKRNVGYIGLGIDEKYNAEHEVKSGFVNGIGVLPAFRRRGIGTRLMLHGLNALKAKGMTSATLDTEDNNPTRAITLYEKIGFQVLQEYVTYAKKLRT